MRASRFTPALALAVVLLGFGLRVAPWGRDRSLEDEALYAYWGLQIATGRDPWLRHEPVDKPPLHPYTLALALRLLGNVPTLSAAEQQEETTACIPCPAWTVDARRARQLESAVRFPSLFASVASIAIVATLGRELYGGAVGLVAACLLALSPFDIPFASTAFTDPFMTAWALAALWAAVVGRLGSAGLLVGLATATKQQGVFFLPLVLAVGLAHAAPREHGLRAQSLSRRLLQFGLGFGAVLGSALLWDLHRGTKPGFLAQGIASYGGLRIAQAADLPERAADWLRLLGQFWASPVLYALLALAGLVCLLRPCPRGLCPSRKVDGILTLFVFAYLVAHWLFTFQTWDRYLLGLVPLLALLAARVLTARHWLIPTGLCTAAATALLLFLLAVLLPVSLKSVRGYVPVGGDHGAYDNIDALASCMRQALPAGGVLYDHWLGHHYRFYLYGAPWRIHWYPNTADLVRDATIYRREPRGIAFPSWRDSAAERAALAASGLSLVPVCETVRRDGSVSFQFYRLEGP